MKNLMQCEKNQISWGSIPDGLEELIDQNVLADFSNIRPMNKRDQNNSFFQELMSLLEHHRPMLCYARVVYSDKAPVIPQSQLLLGFKPLDGLCLFTSKEGHKNVLCQGQIQKISYKCLLVHSLQYLLLELDKFRVWSYIPPQCNSYCPIDIEDGHLRRILFE